MKSFRVVAAAVAFAAGLIVGLGGCASSGGSPEPLPEPGVEIDLGTPGDVIATYDNVEFYPACGNETLAHEGEMWFPFTPADTDGFPSAGADAAAATAGWGGGGSGHGVALARVPMVIAPGPGDAVGTLTVYEGGFAYWTSDSGDLDTWLTNTKLTYNWVC